MVRESTEMGERYHLIDAEAVRCALHQRDISHSGNEWLYRYDAWRVAIG